VEGTNVKLSVDAHGGLKRWNEVKTITVDFWGTLLFDGPASDNRYKKRRLADLESLLTAAGIEPTARAEAIPVEGFVALARALSTANG